MSSYVVRLLATLTCSMQSVHLMSSAFTVTVLIPVIVARPKKEGI